jgi:hypothetical protein
MNSSHTPEWRVLPLIVFVACGDSGGPGIRTEVAELVAPPLTELIAARVEADVSAPDPGASYWKEAPAGELTLLAQPIITPRPERVLTEKIVVQSVTDGKSIAFRLRWKDTEKSDAGGLGQFSDAVALEFPMSGEALPSVMMGSEGQPVHIFHWRAQYQRDAEKGKPTMSDLYPNASVDMYAMDFHDAPGGSKEEREMFNPGVALGNPQSSPKSGVDEIIAEGFSTSAVQSGHGSTGKGEWKDGQWTVVISRPLRIDGGSTIVPGGKNAVAFAAWQGGQGEVGSRKSVVMAWTPLQVKP